MMLAPYWQDRLAAMEATFGDRPIPGGFLQHPVTDGCGFLVDEPGRVERCRRYLLERGSPLLDGDDDGLPFIPYSANELAAGRHWTGLSGTTIHHAYHLERWSEITGLLLSELRSVVEWGGGFGNMARLVLSVAPDCRYTIIDMPFMERVQRQFLAGCGDVHWARYVGDYRGAAILAEDGVREDGWGAHSVDLFVATWSLDESPAAQQRAVAAHGFFGAEHLLIAMHPGKDIFPESHELVGLLGERGTWEAASDGQSIYVFD